MSVESWLRARQKDGQRIGFLKTGEGTLRDMLKPLLCAILSIPPEYGFALPGMVELLWWWNLYADTEQRKHYDDYKYLKDVLHRPKQRSLENLKKHDVRIISGKAFGSHHPSSEFGKGGLEHFRADATTRRASRQPAADSGSPAQRSVVSFPLCRTSASQQAFHFTRGEPLSRHQRAQHLFRQVLRSALMGKQLNKK